MAFSCVDNSFCCSHTVELNSITNTNEFQKNFAFHISLWKDKFGFHSILYDVRVGNTTVNTHKTEMNGEHLFLSIE